MAVVVAAPATGVCACQFWHQVAAWHGGQPSACVAASFVALLHEPTARDQ